MPGPDDALYTKTHEWIRIDGDTAAIGITDHAVDQLGDLTFVELPESGSSVKTGERFGEIESTKTVSDLYAPLGGEVVEVNDGLADDVGPIASSPFNDGWLIKVRLSGADGREHLLSAAEYAAHIETEEHEH